MSDEDFRDCCEDFEDCQGHNIPARPFVWIDTVVVALSLAEDLFDSLSTAAETLKDLTCSHANYLVERKRFSEQAAREIEALTRGLK